MARSDLVVHDGRWFVVEQCRDCPLPGYLIVQAKTPAEGWTGVCADALVELGPLLQRVVRSLECVLRPARVYVAQFGEQAADFHFHVFPRTTALTRRFLLEFPGQKGGIHGPVLLDWARQRYRNVRASEETSRVLAAVREDMKRQNAHAVHRAAARFKVRTRPRTGG